MKKRVLIITTSLKFGGGGERVAALISKILSDRYDVFFITFEYYSNLYPHKGIHYCLDDNLGFKSKIQSFKLLTLVRIFRVFKLIKKINPDIIISIMHVPNLITLIAKLLFQIDSPLIFSIHTNTIMRFRKHMRYMNFLIRKLYKNKKVNKIIPICKDNQLILENYYNIQKDKFQVIYNGLEIKKIRKKAKEEIYDYPVIFNDSNITKYINIGRLEEVKGHYYLIKAFSLVKSKIDNSKLFILGEGSLKKELKSYTKEIGLKNDIFFLGLRKNPYKYLSKCDIFVLSSKHEAFPLSLLEALACELPIISTRCKTGPEEILEYGKYGLLVNVNDPEDLAEKMITLATDQKLLKKFSNNSLERAKFFDIESIREKWIKLIESYINY